jgi:NAD(P)H-hydrate repair Nnr-like enzyme with NAD(P)H-hydrate dehydratase domain
MKLFSKPTHSASRRPQDSFVHRVANDPYLDWLILVIVAVVIAGIVIGTGFISYQSTQDKLSAPLSTDSGARPVLFDADAMAKTLKTFQARAEEQSTLIKGYAGVADPSL